MGQNVSLPLIVFSLTCIFLDTGYLPTIIDNRMESEKSFGVIDQEYEREDRVKILGQNCFVNRHLDTSSQLFLGEEGGEGLSGPKYPFRCKICIFPQTKFP